MALSNFYGVSAEHFIIGNGSNDIIDLIARTYLGPGLNAITSQYSFMAYGLSVAIAGAEHIVVPSVDYGSNLAGMLAAVNDNTRVLWVANPNNPTGTCIEKHTLEDFLRRVPSHVLIVLDEAYFEYLPLEERLNAMALLGEINNLIILRTFSKIYGLAGLRVGYGVASPDIVSVLNKIRLPFNVSGVGIHAAVHALDDQAFVMKSFELNLDMKQLLVKELNLLDIKTLPSYGNFVTANFGKRALEIYDKLLSEGIIVRPLVSYGMKEFLRITVGTEHEVIAIVDALKRILR